MWNVDEKKIEIGFLKQYLMNRREHRLSENALLIKTRSFNGKELFTYDLMLQNSRFKECKDHIAIQLQSCDENAYYHALTGVCLINTGQVKDGVGHIETALILKPNLSRFRLYIAAVYLLTLEDEEQARRHLEYFDSHYCDVEVMEKIVSLNKRLSSPVHFTNQPWVEEVSKEVLSNSVKNSVPIPDYDFLFYDVLMYFYPES